MPVEFYPRSVPLFDVETCRSLDLHNIAKCVHVYTGKFRLLFLVSFARRTNVRGVICYVGWFSAFLYLSLKETPSRIINYSLISIKRYFVACAKRDIKFSFLLSFYIYVYYNFILDVKRGAGRMISRAKVNRKFIILT